MKSHPRSPFATSPSHLLVASALVALGLLRLIAADPVRWTLEAPEEDRVFQRDDLGGADVVVTATRQSAINVWHTQILRTLTVTADPASARRGGRVTFRVSDAGDPVTGATVRFGSRTARTNAAGKATIAAAGSRGTIRVTASKDGYNANTTAVRVR